MNPIITSVLYWRGWVAKMIIDSIVIIAMAIGAALAGVKNWGALNTTEQVIIICSIVGIAGKNISSLMDKTFANKVAAQEDMTNMNAPSPLATKAENPVDKAPAPENPKP